MKNGFRSNRFILVIGIIICFPLFYSCTRSDQYNEAVITSHSQEIAYTQEPLLLNTNVFEIRSLKEEATTPVVHYNIVIPGRTMQSAEFMPGIQNSISMDGVLLSIPDGGMNQTKSLSITGLLDEDLPPIPDEITNVTKNYYTGYRFLPHGMLFDSAATIAMAYDNSLIPEGFTVEDVYTYYYDESDHKWKALERDSINHRLSLIVSSTLHFTDMINGIIKVPESPETEGFVPTTIKDIKAADPASGITLIAPPVANNEGDAKLSYPLKLPEGRSGMHPQLTLQYSSDGSSGWAGYGWRLNVPGISVDITWGVPRYLNDKESETYQYAGSQLTPVAHRSEYIDRTPEKRFYSRIEGSFSKIIRHGDNPKNYWWEVTTKDGVRNFYGGLPETGIITNGVSFDAAGNIGYWALIETRDLHNNFVHYTYDKPAEGGQQLYIREITYTGHEAEQGPYKIEFLRDDEANTYERKDASINARYGFIIRDRDLLRRIHITYDSEPIRSYTFQYKDGIFLKTLLESVTEYDAAGDEFYTHRFDYYNDIKVDNEQIPFVPEKRWDVPDDDLKGPYLNIFLNSISALGGSASVGGSGSVTATVGLLDGKVFLKSMTAGGTVSYQGSKNEGFLVLIDLNGDELPDKVYKKDGGIYYRPNLLSYPSEEMFGEKKLIAGIDNISVSKTSGFGWGVQANPPSSFIGYDNVDTKTKTSVYFDDFNADGLIDLVDNGVVYFNHLNESGDPVFTTSSELTPNPLYASSEIDLSILPDPAVEQAKLEAQFPLHDAVRMWQAPYSGVISINAPVNLIEDTSIIAQADTYKDGVKVSIQHNGNSLWGIEIDADDYSVHVPDTYSITIDKGDRIYFRVQSRFNGSYDKVYWDPEILYGAINGSDTLVNLEDSNGKIIGRFKASEDFVLSGLQSIGMPKTGAIKIKTAFSKPVTTDSIRIEILYTDTLGNQATIFNREYNPSQNIIADSINLDLEVLKNEFIQFRVLSSTNVDWSNIKWDNYVEYTRIDDGTPLTGNDGKPLLSFKTIPEFSTMFNNTIRYEWPIIADTAFMLSLGLDSIDDFSHPMQITPNLTFNYPVPGGDITLSVKLKNGIVGKKKYTFNGGTKFKSEDTLLASVKLWDSLYFEYYFSGIDFAAPIDTADVIIGSDILNPRKASVFSPINLQDKIFGHLYRGWGQFDYNGNFERATSPIDENLLRLSDNRNDNVASMQDSSDLDGVQNPLDEVFNIMIPYAVKTIYMGTDEQVYIMPDCISSSRLGEKNVFVEPYVFSASGLNAITKVTQSSSKSVAGGLSSLSYSHSWGEDNFIIDMMDMNGDMYPDLLSTDNIQYTGVTGVLSGSSVNHSLGDHYSKSEADGFTLGGSYVYAKSNNSGSKTPSKRVNSKTRDNSKSNKNSESAQETSKSSVGISGSFSTNDDNTDQTWLDINADGLPDKIYSDGTVRLNLGYSYAPAEHWNFDAICVGESQDYGGGIGVNIENGSFTAGVAISKTDNEANETFMDINADGLPDMVKGNNVYFNTGSGFTPPVEWIGLGTLDAGESIGQSANAGFTIGIAIPIFFIKICVNPSASVTSGFSHTLTQLADIDGDGMPDFLSSDSEGELYVKSSTIFRTNILKSVEHPLGSNFSLDYLLTPAVYKHPGGKLALKSVKMFDGLAGDGIDTTYNSFEYKDGFYSRYEREFYGFASVKTHFHDTGNENKIYRTVEQKFSNSDYYTKGMMLTETLTDGEGRNQKGLQHIYSLRDIHTGELLSGTFAQSNSDPLFVALEETRQYSYRVTSEPLITTSVTYTYDTLGNISGHTDYSSGNEKDRYSVAIQYHSNTDNYLFSVPSLQEVSTIEGLRRRNETSINEYGDITQIRQFITSNQTAQFDMEYDEYGNLIKITRPANYKGERMWYEYVYDQAVHSYVTEITDAYGYSSSAVYDYKWGVPVEVADKNKQEMQYSYDDFGRMIALTGPYELASGKPYTIVFEYYPGAEIPYAHTLHYDSVYDSNIETYSFTDGLGRLVQVKKTASLFEDPATEDTPGYIVSGKVMYDAFGRATEVYQPVFEADGNPATYNINPDNMQPTLITYDVLDRILQLILPDGSITTHTYNIGDYNGETMYVDSLLDALNHSSVTYTKANGRQAAIVRKSDTDDIYTSFEYNAIGELLTVTDPMGNITISMYDMLGNRISFDHPDAGLTEFIYDGAGNIIKKITANLRKKIPNDGAISYKYDRERLVEIVYPRNIQNRVNYTYGEPDAPFNRAGRVVLIQDASGGQEFFYSKLGQVIKSIRTIQLGESDMRTWIWSTTYDTWNRAQTMSYPDGEKVNYSYNRAGNLQKMDGEKLGRSYEYISRIGYNKYEKQVYLQYGNGSVTTYNYEPERQRLEQMSVTSNNQVLMNNTYTYDVMNNILGITNSAAATGNIGGATSHLYSYDDLYQLIQASGKFIGKSDTSNYTLAMQYDIMGKIVQKTQTHNKNGKEQHATTYDLGYKYAGPQPNSATEIGARVFTYDENGNQTGWEDTVSHDFRKLSWDEENRLTLISDNGYVNRYVYDASGERVIKSHGGTQGVYINGAPIGIVNHSDDNYTAYVSPYFVFQNDRFTKHYYNGSTRVTSKVGNGQFQNQYHLGVFEITAGGVNYINRQQQLMDCKEEYESQLGIAPGPPTMKGIYADPLFSGTGYPDLGTPDTTTPRGWPKKPVFAPAGGPPGAPIQWGDEITNDNVEPGFGYVGNGNIEEVLRYFYHSNHLGSASYITNARGDVTQFIAYIPFGETLAEQHADWNSPYKFNARELDSETGLYYYGNRYYDPKVSIWLGVDPLAEKYPSISPYVYVANNPVVDKMNGMDVQSVLSIIKQKSAEKSIQLNMVTINSDNVPSSISNLPDLNTGPSFMDFDPPSTENSGEEDPGKKQVEDEAEKKTQDSSIEKTTATQQIEKTLDLETVENVDGQVEETVSMDVKTEKTQQTEVRAIEASDKKSMTKPEPEIKVESGTAPEKVTTLKSTEKKDKIK